MYDSCNSCHLFSVKDSYESMQLLIIMKLNLNNNKQLYYKDLQITTCNRNLEILQILIQIDNIFRFLKTTSTQYFQKIKKF